MQNSFLYLLFYYVKSRLLHSIFFFLAKANFPLLKNDYLHFMYVSVIHACMYVQCMSVETRREHCNP